MTALFIILAAIVLLGAFLWWGFFAPAGKVFELYDRQRKTVVFSTPIQAGDKLTLVREDNKFDDKAIVIQTKDGHKLGYVPEKDNLVFSRLMDAGKLLMAKINTHEVKGTYHKIGIGIYLVDY